MPAQSLAGKARRAEVRSEYFRYLVPTIIGQVAHCCYCLADVFFVGMAVGENGLAALNVALPIFTVYTTFSILIGVGAATTISVCRGEGDPESGDRVFTMAVVSVLAAGALLSVFGTLFLRQIACLFGATDLIVGNVVAYLSPISPLCFVYMLSSAMCVIVRSDGNPRLVMVAGAAGNAANILLDYLFVIPLGMGTFGAGLATIIGPFITCGLLSLHFVTRRNEVRFTRRFFSPRLWWRMVKNGAGSGVLETSAGFVILMFNIVLIRVGGETAVAVFSIISNIGYVGKGIFNGMAQAAQPIISISYGSGWYGRMKAVDRVAMATAVLFSLAVYGVILLFPGQIIGLFISTDARVLAIGVPAVMLYFLSLPFTGANTILMYYFQSIEQSLCTTAVALLRGIVLVYLALRAFSALWGLSGVWLALFAAEALTFAIFFPVKLRLNRGFRETDDGPKQSL